ncbi:MAG: hypothetical protein RR244_06910 [Oscillospiraceae bacterium]
MSAVLLVFVFLFTPMAGAESAVVSSTELIENAKEYDGRTVTFCGEAVGDILPRGENAWVCVCDGNNSATGVYVRAELAKEIEHLGKYGVTGDSVRVVGVFNRACSEHGGDFDIHASSFEIIKSGQETPIVFSPLLAVAAACAFAVAVALIVVVIRRHR